MRSRIRKNPNKPLNNKKKWLKRHLKSKNHKHRYKRRIKRKRKRQLHPSKVKVYRLQQKNLFLKICIWPQLRKLKPTFLHRQA